MTDRNKNKAGYKKTKLGWIPEEWKIIKFNKVFDRITRKNKELNSNILTISAKEGLINQALFYNKRIASVDTSKYILLQKGEFAYNKSYSSGYPMGAIKRLELYDKGVVSSLYICFALNNKNFSSDFLKYYFEAGLLNREIKMIAQEGARNHGLLNMSTDDFFNTFLYAPEKNKEQEKIAEILTCWDDGINNLEQLIEKKELQHKALMQKLLTGKLRLLGYKTKWKHYKFNKVFDRITRKNKELNSNILTISAKEGLINQALFYNKRIASVDTSKYILLQKGEFAYNKSYSSGYPMGAIKRLELYDKGVVSSLYICFALNNKNFSSDFLKYYFEAGLLNREIKMIAQEGARNHGLLNMSTDDFFNTLLYIPEDLIEQEKIAEVLKTSEEEIKILNSKLEALKEQKKGLMQKLLTGEIRVKVQRSI